MRFFEFIKECEGSVEDLKKVILLLQEEKDMVRIPDEKDVIRKAILYRESSQFEKSLSILNQILKEAPLDKENIIYQKIITLKEMNKFNEALNEFENLENIDLERKKLKEFLIRMSK
ncbi:MAG: hypothetical protein C0601_08855 [Candidatus Muiribacterium halophilum]|uniref:Tetratricopeptide repeat protein n=1 Tax=Muiribacterium halophilum TaxID=2053465 RepID=A0A2N5ZE39_MUIH1|nr:MAG: hypothetical protein C0601_08855 [Candidatus Muirbacterium halophilum]